MTMSIREQPDDDEYLGGAGQASWEPLVIQVVCGVKPDRSRRRKLRGRRL